MCRVMAIKLETYYNIIKKQRRLAELYRKYDEQAIFIVPSGLDKELLVQLISENGSFFGKRPHVCTWSDLYREVARTAGDIPRRVIDPPDHNLIINYTLKKYFAELGDDNGNLPPGVNRRGFAALLGDNISELLLEEIFPEELRELLRLDERGDITPEAILCRLYADYMGYLAENNIADSAQIPTLIRQAIALSTNENFSSGHVFIFVGFLSFTGGQLKLVNAMAEMSQCVMILPESGLDSFHDGIRQLKTEYADRPSWSVNLYLLLANNDNLQHEALARELALWRLNRSDFGVLGDLSDYGEIGVQVAPQNLGALQNALSRYKIPHHAQIRENAGQTLVGELLREIWGAWFSGWETKRTIALLASPLLGDAQTKSLQYAEKFPEGKAAWLSLLKGQTRRQFEDAEALCVALTKGGTPLELMTLWRDYLKALQPADTLAETIGDELTLDGVIRDTNAVIYELGKKIDVLQDIKLDIGPAADVELVASEAVAYISDWGYSAKLPISLPQSRSVTIYAGNPPVLTTHKYWIMTGVDYNSWPGTLRESPLLRDDDKKVLNESGGEKDNGYFHIPEIHEQREQREALFRRLLATARSGVILTRSATDSNGRPVGDSQFTEALFDSNKNSQERKYRDVGKTEYPSSRMLPRPSDLWFPGAEVLSYGEKLGRGVFPRVAEKDAGEKMYVSLSSLDDWNKCPFLYWCRKIARLESPRGDIFDYMRAGTQMHKLWEVCWREYLKERISLTQLVIKYWREVAEAEYPELITDPRLRRYEERLYGQALALAETQEQIEARVQTRLHVELEYKLPEYEVEGVVFSGRADRVDFFDGGAVILDYKSARAANYAKSLQLAAYAAVLQEKAGLAPLGYGWFGHKDSKLSGLFEGSSLNIYRETSKRQKHSGLAEKIEQALATMDKMALSVRTGVFPARYESKDCPSCEFSVLCRRKEYPLYQLEEEENADKDGDADE